MSNENKNKILSVAESLFNKYGVRSVSMDDISRELSMSKKTIYQYIKDKDELVTIVTESHIARDKEEFGEVIKNSENAIDELYKLSLCIRNHIKEINPSLLFDIQKYHPKSWSLWIEYKDVYMRNSILNVIAKGKEEGYFRKSIDAEMLSILRVETVQLVFDDKIFPTHKFNFTDVQMMLFDHFVHGLMTVKGLKLYDSLIDAKSYELN